MEFVELPAFRVYFGEEMASEVQVGMFDTSQQMLILAPTQKSGDKKSDGNNKPDGGRSLKDVGNVLQQNKIQTSTLSYHDF